MYDFTTIPIKTLCLVWLIVLYHIERYLSGRQQKQVEDALKNELPKKLEGIITKEEHRAAASYSLDKLKFGEIESVFNLANTCLSYYYMPWLWNKLSLYMDINNEITFSLTYMAIASLPISLFEHFTFKYYRTFYIEEKHGFNKSTVALFIQDYFKQLILSIVIGAPLGAVFIKVARWGGKRLYIYLWILSVIAIVIMMAIAPVLIMPWFNKYEPLKDQELKKKIEILAGGLGFPLYKLEQVDGSKRSGHSNAFFYGFWKFKRIVLYDTLLDLPHDEILGILCHELGHWKMGHIKFNLSFVFVQLFVVLSLFGQVFDNPTIFTAFGYNDPTQSIVLGFALFSELWKPFELLLEKCLIIVSRVFEYQADRFACEQGRGPELLRALTILQKENKGFSDPDHIYSGWYYTHPVFIERAEAIKDEIKFCSSRDKEQEKELKKDR